MGALLRGYGSVQKMLDQLGSSLTPCENQVMNDIVKGVSASKSVLLSDIARATTDGTNEELWRQEKRLSAALGKESSGLDLLPDAYLNFASPVAQSLGFVTVDGSELAKLYGAVGDKFEKFEKMCWVKDSSAPGKPLRLGYWMVNIEATDGNHQHLPLWKEIYSTEDPDYQMLGEHAWNKTFRRGIEKVIQARGKQGAWLFDRGFDSSDWIHYLGFIVCLLFVVRLRSNHKLEVGDVHNPKVMTVKQLAFGLVKPYSVAVPYVNKSTHKLQHIQRSFTFIPVRQPGLSQRLWLIVIKGRKQDWYLLCNAETMNEKRASEMVLAYILRWGNEEETRCYKQCTGAENFRVRKLRAIRRLLFLAMLAMATQALLLFLNPQEAKRVMAKVQAFIQKVLFPHYRLWDGMAIVLKEAT